jgi:hypothetical protein
MGAWGVLEQTPIDMRKSSLLAGVVPANNHDYSAFVLILSLSLCLLRIPRVHSPLVPLLRHELSLPLS